MKKLLMITAISLVLGLMAGPAFAISFKFDFQHLDGTPDPNGTEGLLLRETTVKIDIYLTEWESLPNVSAIDYYFTWDPGALDVVDVTLVTAQNWTEIFNAKVSPGVYFLGVADFSGPGGTPGPGVPGPELLLHTIEIKGVNIPQYYIDIKATLDDPVGGNDGVIIDVAETWYEKGEVVEAQGKIHSICREHSFECSADNPCDRWRAGYICPGDVTEPDEDSYEIIAEDPPFCRGETIHVKHTYIASYPVEFQEVYDSMCDSECFNKYFDNYLYGVIPECFYQCIEVDSSGYCDRLEDECDIIHQEVNATSATYAYCASNYNPLEEKSYWIEYCGLYFEGIPVTVRVNSTPDCQGTIRNGPAPPELSGVGMGGIDITLPLDLTPGKYDICAEVGGESIRIDEIDVTSDGCPTSTCTIQVPYNPFRVGQQCTSSLDIALQADDDANYIVSLEHSVGLPPSLQLRSSAVTVAGGEGTIWLDTSDPQPADLQNYWANVRIKAEKTGNPNISCEATLDYEIEALSAKDNCEWDDDFSLQGAVYGGAARLGLNPATQYNVYVMNQANWDKVHLTSPAHQTTFTTDSNGNMACGTMIWGTTQTNPASLPAYFDIVIDANNDHQFNVAHGDVIDSFMICLSSDGDGVCDDEDNCPNHPNGPARGTCTQVVGSNRIVSNKQYCTTDGNCDPGEYCEKTQADNYPPGGNGIGDACECEADFNCDGAVAASDVTIFLDDFGRSQYVHPCTNEDQCSGDFDCNGAVAANDVTKFLEDFGRSKYNNSCPACDGGAWCSY